MQSPRLPVVDIVQPSETTPLISRTGEGSESRRLKLYINNFRRSLKRRQRLTALRQVRLDLSGASEQPSGNSTLVSCAGRDASPTWQSSCKSSQPESLRSPLLSKQFHNSFLSSVSLNLENHGSVARDHLASERTFLAYVRTSLAIASSGVALVQLFTVASSNLQHYRLLIYIRPLGAVTIIMGLTVLSIGVVRYFSVQAALTKGYFPVARAVIGFITLILFFLVFVTFAILVVGRLGNP